MPASTITTKGQVTIPKPIRDAMGVSPGDRVRFTRRADGVVVIEPETVDLRSLKGLFRDRVGEPVSLEDMERAIADAVVENGES